MLHLEGPKRDEESRGVEQWDCKSFSLVDVDDIIPILKQCTLLSLESGQR